MACKGSVKLAVYSTFKDDGTKKAERAIAQLTKDYGKLDEATGKVKLDDATRALFEQSIQADLAAAKWQGYSDNLAEAGQALTKYVSAAAGAATVLSTKLASDYQDGFAKVKTIMDKSAEAPAAMSRKILDLSTNTGKAATELTEATYQALSASVETSKAVGFVGDAVNLAKAGFTDTSTAVDTLTTVINSYKMSAEDALSVSDKLVQTQNDGKTTVGELGASMGTIIPIASSLNVNLDNVLTSYAIMTKQGIKTTDATTALKNTMSELSDEGSTVAGILREKTGKTFGELMSEGASLGDVLNVLYEHVGGNGEAFKNLWGNMRAGTGALAIANAGAAGFSNELERMRGASGTVAAALEDLQTPSAKANKAINAVKNTGIELGGEFLGALTPGLEAAASAAQGLYRDFSQMDQGSKQAVAGMLATAAASGPAVLGLSKVAGGVSTAIGKYGEFSAKLGQMSAAGGNAAKAASLLGAVTSGPVVLGLAAAGVAVAAITKGIFDWKKRTDEVSGAQRKLTEAVTTGAPSLSRAAADMSGYGAAAQRTRVDIADVTRAQSELADAIEKRNESAQADINRLEGARSVLAQYMNQTDLTAQQQGKLRDAVAYVNEACGTQYQVVDAAAGKVADETGAILDNTSAIDENIRARQEQIRVDALSENLTGLYKQQADDIAAVAQAQRDFNAAVAALAEAEAAGVTGDRWQELAGAVDDAGRSLDEAKRDLDSVNSSISATESQLGSMQRAASGAEMTIGDLARTRVEIQQIVPPEQLDAFCSQLEQSGIAVESFSSLTQGQMMDLATSYDGSMDSIIRAAEKMGIDVPNATQSGMSAAASAIDKAAPEQKAAARRSYDAVIATFGQLKSSAPSEGAAGASGFASGIASGEGAVSESAGSLSSTAATEISKGDYWTYGNHAAKNFANGLKAGEDFVSGAASTIAEVARSILGHTVPKRGPLHVGGRGEAVWGEHAVENFAKGMAGGIGMVERVSGAVGRAAASGFSASPGGGYAGAAATAAGQSAGAGIDYDRLARAIARAVGRPETNITVNEAENAELTAARVAARMREEAMCA